MPASTLLKQHMSLFTKIGKPVLDLACGSGRNGLHLQEQGFPVIFADKNSQALAGITADSQTREQIKPTQCWQVDFESGEQQLLPNSYQAIMVFRYLHRPLLPQLKQAVCAGGIVIYETFTTDNRQFGRPHRDEFLLQPGELKQLFADWQCLHYFEGIKTGPDRAIAQIVCRKT
ncbi:MAG: tellurite methyltransferase [Moritella sp.]|jgi:tellurite methyltransferase